MADTNQVRTLSVRQIMDSSDYARGAREFVTANRDMSQSSAIVGTIVQQTQVKISNAADGVSRMTRAFDPAAAAAADFQNNLIKLNKNLETGKLSAEDAGRQYAGMVQKFKLAADGANIMAQGYTQLGKVVSATNEEMLRFAQASREIEEARAELDRMTSSAATLRAAIDPIGTSQARLNSELAEYGKLLRNNKIDAEEFAAAENLARTRHEQFVASLNKTPTGANDNGAGARRHNLAYQGFDIGQGLASGMPVGMIAAQQLPQIAQEYIGGGGGAKLAADLGAARVAALGLAGAISPIGWAFAGVTALATAFYFSARKEAKTTDDVLKEHAANIKALGEAYGIAEDRAKKYSEADRAIALAAESTSAADLAQKRKDSVDTLSQRFGAPYGRVPGFTLRADLGDFAKPFNALRSGTATVEEFIVAIRRIGEEKGMQTQANSILDYAKQLKLVDDQMLEHIRLQELVRFPNLTARTDEADAATKLRIQNADDLINMQRQHAAALAGIGARSPEELAAAARQRVLAQPLNPGEDLTNRQYRANAEAALAYAQAENDLRTAKEERVRSSNAALAAAQNELALIGKSVAEQNRLRAAYEAEAQIREAAARANVAADETEIAAARKKAAAIADINAQISLGRLVQDQGYQAQQLQREADLIGRSVEERARSMAALQAEIQLKQQGIDTSTRLAQNYIAEQAALAGARAEIDRQNAAFQSLQQSEGTVIDDLLTGTGNLQSRLRAAAADVLKFVSQLGANSVKNYLTGTNLPTFADLFSGKPKVPGLSTTSTPMMTVTATTVMINGGVTGGLNPFAGATAKVPGIPAATNPLNGAQANVLAQQPDLIAGVLAAKGANTGLPLGFVGNYRPGTDPRLLDILNQAALRTPGFKVDAFSGFRRGDPRYHGEGLATDVRLTDLKTGLPLSNYQSPGNFRAYEQFAQNARLIQMQQYPDLNNQFRWGGYFSGPAGKYGAMDMMHFDLDRRGVGMGGGSWRDGLNPRQRSLFPGVQSEGFNALNQDLKRLSATTVSTNFNMANVSNSSKDVTSSFSSLISGLGKKPSGGTSGGNLFSWIGNLFGFADGTDSAPGGLARVNERGGEIINLPRGSQVIPAHKADAALRRSGPQTVVHRYESNIVVSGNGDKELMERVRVAADEISRGHLDQYRANTFNDDVERYNNSPYDRG